MHQKSHSISKDDGESIALETKHLDKQFSEALKKSTPAQSVPQIKFKIINLEDYETAKAFALALEKCAGLKSFYAYFTFAKDVNSETAWIPILEALQRCIGLRSLNLVGSRIEEKGIPAFTKVLHQNSKTLVALHLNNLISTRFVRTPENVQSIKNMLEALASCSLLQTFSWAARRTSQLFRGALISAIAKLQLFDCYPL